MDKKYKALRVIGTFYKVVGIIMGALTILLSLSLCAISIWGGSLMDQFGSQIDSDLSIITMLGSVVGGLVMGFAVILYGGSIAITLYAVGELTYLLLALEENTRATATLLRQQSIPPEVVTS
jgi:hypothetical protein